MGEGVDHVITGRKHPSHQTSSLLGLSYNKSFIYFLVVSQKVHVAFLGHIDFKRLQIMHKWLIQNAGDFEHPMFLLTIVDLASYEVDRVGLFVHPSFDGSSFGYEKAEAAQGNDLGFVDFEVRREYDPEPATPLDGDVALEDYLVDGILATVLQVNIVEVIGIKRRRDSDALHGSIIQLCDQVLLFVHDFEDEALLVLDDRVVEFADEEYDLGVVVPFACQFISDRQELKP